jgi:ubiquinone/menaquinone biosynthesis C-methylase UbiE/DNA-binding MarR family transcriptional regulator
MLQTLKALADSSRLRLLAVVARGEFTVQELTAILETGQSRISHHLKILSAAGLVTVKRQGTWAYYRLDRGNPLLGELWPALEKRLEQLDHAASDRRRLLDVLEMRRRRSQDFFDAHARQWDLLARQVLPVADYQALLLEHLTRCGVLLEVGAGTGRLLAALRRKAERVLVVDHSPAMLEEALARAETEGLDGIDFRLGDMSHLPLTDSEAEWAVLNMVLHHAAQPRVVLCELFRVLENGGGLVIADLQRHDQEWVREKMADQWLGFDVQELEEWLTAAGFEGIRFVTVPGRAGELDVLVGTARKP